MRLSKPLLLLCLLLYGADLLAGEQHYLNIHFLYGSKPLKKYRDTEQEWFGGLLGGHVGIEGDSDRIVSFVPAGSFHLLAKKNDRHSRWATHDRSAFYGLFGTPPDSVKYSIIRIPVSVAQYQQFKEIVAKYQENTPYDYAFVGMRCGAAASDILGQLGILPDYSVQKTSVKVFYPAMLRKRLLKMARAHHWTVTTKSGSVRRKWEK